MRRIGMIEDDHELVQLVTGYMNDTGRYYIAWATEDGEEGLSLMREDPVDLVLLDIVIPGHDGLYVLEKLSTMPKRPACIVFSGMGQIHVMRKAIERGADYFLLKPVFLDVLLRRIDDVLDSEGISIRPAAVRTSNLPKNSDVFTREVLYILEVPRMPHGHDYLLTALKLAITDGTYLTGGITKRLYPSVAKVHGVTSHQVERGIRHVLMRAWQRTKGRSYNQLLGHGNAECPKPTTGELISSLMDLYSRRQ